MTVARRVTGVPTKGYKNSRSITITFGSWRARHVLGRNLVIYRGGWHFVVGGLLEPLLYLAGIGLGFSYLVGQVVYNGRSIPYSLYVAPGLLASAAMTGAVSDALQSVYSRLRYAKCYEAMIATPMSAGDIAFGEMGWAVLRCLLYSASFLVAMVAFGYVDSWWAVGCLPAAALIGTAFVALAMATTTYMRSWADVENVQLIVLPMFLFSCIFFPISVYPIWLAWIVRLSPLYQGVALERGLDTGAVSTLLGVHVAYLIVISLVSTAVVTVRMERTLTP